MAKFVHLHVHSHYSLLDGLGKIDELVKRAKELEMEALALTDHGNMHGALEFYTKCKKAGIKPILGVEAYLAARGMLDKTPKIDAPRYHQILLAKDEAGYRNLLFLVSEAHTKGMYYKPRIDLDLLAKNSKGLIATSSCLAGMIPEAIVAGDLERAYTTAKKFTDIFGEDFYLELQHHPSLPQQGKVNEELVKMSQELKIPLIATGDVHYVKPEDKATHEVLLAINTGGEVNSDDGMSMGEVDISMRDEDFFRQAFSHVPEIIDNTAAIAAKCDIQLNLGENILPDFDVPEGFTENSYLEHLCREGIKKRYKETTPEIEERLSFELATVTKMGFASYFLIVADFVNWAKDQRIYVGPGRGSAAGSIIAYLTGITDLDPFPYGFLFERFLNPDRISMPDIDMDFADDDRDRVINYVREKYGADHVAGIATFGTMMGRAAVRDVGRVLGMPYIEVDQIAKMIPTPVQGRHIPLRKSIENVAELKQKYDSDPRIKTMLDFACNLEGNVRHASQHACAFVICKEPTVHYTAVQPAQQGREGVITQYSMKPIEDIGLLKMDFLGLSNLTIMRNAVRIIRKVYGQEIDIYNLPLDDKKTFELLSSGDTTGVFQLESDGMKHYIRELKPTRLEDIIAMVSLYRPGPMANIPSYIARKHGREPVVYLHPKLAESLGETYGIPVYQEQVMQASKDIAGFTGGEADTLRKAMGKKIASLMAEMKEKFVSGCKNHSNIDRPLAEKIFAQFEEFAAYGFNKSHAGCYAMIAYQTAYLKANYPAAFFAALLTSNADNLDKMSIEMSEASKMGIAVLPPDVNESFPEFGVIKNENEEYIRFGMAAVKNVGHDVVEQIVEERKNNGKFTTFQDFIARLTTKQLNRKSLEALIECGAMDALGERATLLANLDGILDTARTARKNMLEGQFSLFSDGGTDEKPGAVLNYVLKPAPEVSTQQKVAWEKELLGIYVTAHPLDDAKEILDLLVSIKDVKTLREGDKVAFGGVISKVHKITTRKGESMAFLTFEDLTGEIETVCFPNLYTQSIQFIEGAGRFVVCGKVSEKDGEPKVILDQLLELNEENAKAVASGLSQTKRTLSYSRSTNGTTTAKASDKIMVPIPNNASEDIFTDLKNIFEASPGETQVILGIPKSGGETQKVATSFKVAIDDALRQKIKDVLVRHNTKAN